MTSNDKNRNLVAHVFDYYESLPRTTHVRQAVSLADGQVLRSGHQPNWLDST